MVPNNLFVHRRTLHLIVGSIIHTHRSSVQQAYVLAMSQNIVVL